MLDVNEYLVDSGAGVDLLSAQHVEEHRETVQTREKPLPMNTASGRFNSTEVCHHYGMMVWFRPARTIYDLDKTQPRLQAGILLGYRLNGGHKWNGEYRVADLDLFVGMDLDERASPTGV